jgi:hypothetical protein
LNAQKRDKWTACINEFYVFIIYLFLYVYLFIFLAQYSSVKKSRRMRWAGHVAHMKERRGIYRVLVGKPEGKRPLGRPRLGWEDSIKMNLREVECGGMHRIDLAEDRDRWRAPMNVVMNLRVPLNAGNLLTS